MPLRRYGLPLILLMLLCRPSFTYADALDDVLRAGELIWGGDKEGGGPYIFPDEQDPGDDSKLRGFEVELAELIAVEIGRTVDPPIVIKPRFQQGQWEQVPQLLDTGRIHIALNGYELRPAFQRAYRCTRPYYIYGLQLLARNDAPLNAWDDLKRFPDRKWRIGVLNESAAARYAGEEKTASLDGADLQPWAEFFEIYNFDGNTEAMQKVVDGGLDLTLLDDCAALFYAEHFPTLKFIGKPVGQGAFVMLVNRDQERLQQAVNHALGRLITDGRLSKLYDRWDLAGKQQQMALRSPAEVPPAPKMDWLTVLRTNLPVLLKAAGMTVLLACASMPLAIVIGILVAIGRLYGPSWVKYPCVAYVELIRGTPLMLQLYAIYFLLPAFGIQLWAIAAGIIGLAVNYSAYEAEIYRAGLQAIPRGQMEASLALGMSRAQAVRRVILPQALRIVIPPVTNDFIALFKDTSVCSVITIVELTKQYSIQSRSTNAIVELAIMTSILYLLMSYPLSLLTRWSERKLQPAR